MRMVELGPHKAFHKYDTFKQKILEEGAPVIGRVCFDYQSSDGETYRRVVDVQAYLENHQGHYTVGFCHLRQELRTFSSAGAIHVWDVGREVWHSNLLSWCLRVSALLEAPLQPLTEQEGERLRSMKWDTPAYHQAEAEEASRDLDMVERRAVNAGWRTSRTGPNFEGQQGLLFYAAAQRARHTAVYYMPRASLIQARAREGASPWTWDLLPWRIMSKGRFTKAYFSIWEVIWSLQNRSILPLRPSDN